MRLSSLSTERTPRSRRSLSYTRENERTVCGPVAPSPAALRSSIEASPSQVGAEAVAHLAIEVLGNKELGTTTKDMALPIRKLIAEGMISAKGKRRATAYFRGRKAKN